MIHLQHITKWYPLQKERYYIFKDFSLHIPHGAKLGLIGANGSGKSTFIRMLNRTEYPNMGSIRIQGSVSWPVASGSGFQASLSGLENVRLVCRIYGILGRRMQSVVDFVHESSGIGDFFFEPIKNYSSGMQARFSFMLSMAFEFDVYLLDEVTAVGDQSFREQSQRWLQGKISKAAMIYASHSLNEVKRICTHVLVFQKNLEPQFFENVADGIQFYIDHIQMMNKEVNKQLIA
ncbi:MAG: ABC transporter ATP-binding protein [Puniceicoccales bacterium]|jgi:capsular polysaccharide transport system ATP-binding protein|nr:ABC transporter ATP-binding protein [Puniceicoccales bacterium]